MMKLAIHGDAVQSIQQLPDNSIDLMITDPPYGISYYKTLNYKRKTPFNFKPSELGDSPDEAMTLVHDTLQAVHPKLKDGSHLYIFTKWNVFPYLFQIAVDTGYKPKNLLVWQKIGRSQGDLYGAYNDNNEYILYAVKPFPGKKSGRKLNGKRDFSVITGIPRIPSLQRIHPFQKPDELYKFLIEKSTNPGETVIDPFAGSGTVVRACTQTGRGFIAIEKDKDYFDVIKAQVFGIDGANGVEGGEATYEAG